MRACRSEYLPHRLPSLVTTLVDARWSHDLLTIQYATADRQINYRHPEPVILQEVFSRQRNVVLLKLLSAPSAHLGVHLAPLRALPKQPRQFCHYRHHPATVGASDAAMQDLYPLQQLPVAGHWLAQTESPRQNAVAVCH